MMTVFASLIGFITSFVPTLIKLWQDKTDKQHELSIMQLQIQSAQADRDIRQAEIGTNADVAESDALYKTYNTGVSWVDALNGTVRPLITYAFFFLYASTKWTHFSADMPWLIWNQEDQAIFAGIISFYFGQRAMSKRLGK
jgi:hypothetical protein